jgi:uncharacterized coiled-coil protein SlyX
MPDKQDKEYSKISMRVGDVQVEFEGTPENIKKLMDKEMFDLAKKMEANAKLASPSPEGAAKTAPKTPQAASKEKPMPPPSKPSTASGIPSKKPGKPNKKATNWRNVATALMIASIVLLASVVGVIAFYWPTVDTLNSQVAEKDITIADLTENVTDLTDQMSDLQASLNQKDAQIDDLEEAIEYSNSLIEHYSSILLMNETSPLVTSTEFTLNASESEIIYQNEQYGLDYAGYVGVSVESSSNTTYVQLFYTYKGFNFDQNVTVGESGAAYFAVLPSFITIKIGNTDEGTSDVINGTVSARYYY